MEKYLKIVTLLYVEDEEGIREQTLRALKRYAKEVYVATNGLEGLELYKQYKPDIVVTDIQMPKMTGITMSKEIKLINDNQAIIITSAHSDANFFIEAIDLQLSGYILKPINKNMLKNKIIEIVKTQQLNKELEEKKEQLSQSLKMVAIGDLIGNIAHHWRQPLNVMATGITSIQLKKNFNSLEDDFIDETCDLINRNAQYLSKIIDDFSAYIKHEKTKRVFPLSKNIDDFLALVRPFTSDDIEIILDLDDNIKIKAYQNELIQCYMNIFNNSKDAMHDIEDKKYIFIKTYTKNDEIIIKIKDNGGGVEQSILDRIFEPYTTTKHKSKGVGLSLHMTYNMIQENMNGTIQIKNKNFEYNGKNYVGAQVIIKFKQINE